MNLAVDASLFTLRGYFLNAVKSYDMGQTALLLPLKEVVLRFVIALKNPSSSAGFEPNNLGSNGKHNDHYTTKNEDNAPK
jgi:hypothetical protein